MKSNIFHPTKLKPSTLQSNLDALVLGRNHLHQHNSTRKNKMKNLSNLDGYETLPRYLIVLICGLGILSPIWQQKVLGSEPNTNDTTRIMISTEMYRTYMTKEPKENETFWEHFTWHFPKIGDRSSIQELDYPADFSLLREYERDEYDSEDMNERGQEIFSDAILYSLRDSFVSWLNLERFKRRNKPAKYFSTKLFEGSIGGTLEESRRDALSLDPTSAESTKQWVDSFTRRNRVQYGIKPFNSSPYCYLSIGFGSQKGKMPLLISNSRIYSVITREGIPRIKQEFLVPFGKKTQLSIGASCYPTMLNEENFKSQYASKISTEIGGAIVYASVGGSGPETLAIAGLSMKF